VQLHAIAAILLGLSGLAALTAVGCSSQSEPLQIANSDSALYSTDGAAAPGYTADPAITLLTGQRVPAAGFGDLMGVIAQVTEESLGSG
jgi:hypothetical protein